MPELSKAKRIILILILIAGFLPLLQQITGQVKVAGLGGAVYDIKPRPLTKNFWFTGKFQKRYERFLITHFGFRPSFIRMKNQIDWSLFSTINSGDVAVLGKDNYLFESSYIKTWQGKDLVEGDTIQMLVDKLQFVSTELEKHGTKVLVAIAPNKVKILSDYLPPSVTRKENTVTNYDKFLKAISKSSIPYIDFNRALTDEMQIDSFPLFSRFGTHWSMYGAVFASDTLINRMSALQDANYSSFTKGKVRMSDTSLHTDHDLLAVLNLMYPLGTEQTAKVKLNFDSGKPKAKVLSISDSYYWSFYHLGVIEHCFDTTSQFLFYNKTVVDEHANRAPRPKDFDILAETLNKDIVLLLATDANLFHFSFGYIDEMHDTLQVHIQPPTDTLTSDGI